MDKNIIKIFILACITIILIISNNCVYAADFNAGDYDPGVRASAQDVGEMKTIGNTIVGVIRTVGSIVSVGVLIVLGIKYMAGSVEERAEYKKSMGHYVIGAAFVFGIINILAIIIDISGLF